jgi:DNA repair exonuclease SbcCD nuclease subunit
MIACIGRRVLWETSLGFATVGPTVSGATMRLLHFADLHLDTPFRWATPELTRSRRQALRQTLHRICELAGEHQVDALTCGGDLYQNERFTPDTVAFLGAIFAALDPLPVFLAPGNHDWFGPKSLYRQLDWSPNVHVLDAAAMTNKRIVQKRDDGNWEVRKPGATKRVRWQAPRPKASIVHGRFSATMAAERCKFARSTERSEQDTIAPGNDPRSSKG